MGAERQSRRRICLFSDGTGNSSHKLFKTNVWRLYDALKFDDVAQIAYYDDGVGSSTFKPWAMLSGAFGFGLARNVQHIYAFLCRNYQPGDDIYCFGFSRGAFTIRVVLALIQSEGLAPYYRDKPNAEAQLNADVKSAYRHFASRRNTFGVLAWPVRSIRNLIAAIDYRLAKFEPYSIERNYWAIKVEGAKISLLTRKEKQQLDDRTGLVAPNNRNASIPVKFVGLWDTVSAYGLPIDELTRAWDKYFWPLSIDTRRLPENVHRACHALCIDDERNTFHPVLWSESAASLRRPYREQVLRADEEDAGSEFASASTDQERVTQVWFAGTHADVGGGYPEDSLSYVSLNWMIGEIQKEAKVRYRSLDPQTLLFDDEKVDTIAKSADTCGKLHDSRRGVASYYRYNPRNVEALVEAANNQNSHFRMPPKIHYSVLERILVGVDGYIPFNLPSHFLVVDHRAELINPAQDKLLMRVSGFTIDEMRSVLEARRAAQEYAWDFVWSKRVTYFATLFLSLFLLAMPFVAQLHESGGELGIYPGEGVGACLSQSAFCPLSDQFGEIGAFLPTTFHKWLHTYQSNPGLTLAILLVILALNQRSRALSLKIRDLLRPLARQLEYFIEARSQSPFISGRTPRTTKPQISVIREVLETIRKQRRFYHPLVNHLRNSEGYDYFWHVVSHKVVPFIFCIAVAYLGVAAIVQFVVGALEASGRVCQATTDVKPFETNASITFNTNDPCQSFRVSVRQGNTYKIKMKIAEAKRWGDVNQYVGVYGMIPEDVRFAQTLLTPFRRHFGETWFKPILRIGARGKDIYPINPFPSIRDEREKYSFAPDAINEANAFYIEYSWIARTSGELFIYVNGLAFSAAAPKEVDVSLGRIFADIFNAGGFYANHKGFAEVTLELVRPTSP